MQRLKSTHHSKTTAIMCDAPVSAPLSPAVDSDLLRFNVAECYLLQLTVLNDTPARRYFITQSPPPTAPALSLPDALPIYDAVHGFDLQRDCGPLPASGNPYQIEVQDQGLNDTGTYVAFLQRLTAAVACESMLDCVIDAAVESDLGRFPVTDGQTVQITVLNGTPAGSN